MDEILYELREHAAGLNCGRWDYIFSFIKKFRNRPDFMLPDRGSVTMERHFLKSYVDLLIKTCHRRGAHAMGGMAAQIPIRNDPEANDAAMTRVRADKLREAQAGHDGTWIAHPGLAGIALEAFDSVMTGPNQLDVLRLDASVAASDLLQVPQGAITEAGLRHNIRVGSSTWRRGWVELAACPSTSSWRTQRPPKNPRAQILAMGSSWARTADGEPFTAARFDAALDEELQVIAGEVGAGRLRGSMRSRRPFAT